MSHKPLAKVRKDADKSRAELIEELEALRNHISQAVVATADTTESPQVKEARKSSEAKFRAIFDNAGVAIFLADVATGEIIDCNQVAEHLIGRSREEIIGLHQTRLHPADNAEVNRRNFLLHSRDKRVTNYETRVQHRDGRVIPVIINAMPLTIDGRKLMMGFFIDISERKRAEEALDFERSQLLSIFEGIDDVVYVTDPYTYEVLYANKAMKERFGGDLTGGICYREFQRRDTPCDFCTNPIILGEKGKPYQWEYYNPTVGRYFMITDRIIKWPDGRDVRFEIAKDITERRQAEEAVRESEEKFRVLAESSSAMFWLYQGERFVYVNGAGERLTGYTIDELLRMRFWDVVHPGDRDIVKARGLARQRGEPVPQKYEVRLLTKSGETRWAELTAGRIMYRGAPAGIATFFDITERKRGEGALRESEEKFRALADTSFGLIAVHRGSKLLYVNDPAVTITGYSKAELLNMNFWELFPADTQVLIKKRALARLKGKSEPVNYETKILTRDGKIKWVNLTAGLFVFEGKPAIISTIFDITERKRVEEELKDAKQHAELYLDLMGHDINNMHQIALGYLEMAEGMMPRDDNRRESLEKPIGVLYRSSRLIQNVRKLQKLKEGVFQSQDVDVCKVLGDVQRESGSVPGKAVSLNMNGHEHYYVRANELLYDVFANLLSNAIKHTGDRADIVVDLAGVKDKGGRYCRVSVDDNGPGIPDDFKGKIFNRLLEGDSKAKGMGLGLFLVKSLVESYGGRVWVEDRVAGDHTKGARFVVMLPVSD